MIRLMEFLRDAAQESDFDFLQQTQRDAASSAVDRGVQCIIRCQVMVEGKPTVWCGQHDAVTLQSVSARS